MCLKWGSIMKKDYRLGNDYKPAYNKVASSNLYRSFRSQTGRESSSVVDSLQDQLTALIDDKVIVPEIWERTLSSYDTPHKLSALVSAVEGAESETLARFILKLLVEVYDADTEGEYFSDTINKLRGQFGL